MNDYWKEVENIASSEVSAGRGDSEGDGEAQDEEQQKIPEGRCLHFVRVCVRIIAVDYF